jgi:hypothetical protein
MFFLCEKPETTSHEEPLTFDRPDMYWISVEKPNLDDLLLQSLVTIFLAQQMKHNHHHNNKHNHNQQQHNNNHIIPSF